MFGGCDAVVATGQNHDGVTFGAWMGKIGIEPQRTQRGYAALGILWFSFYPG
jgi:hypothetical protein